MRDPRAGFRLDGVGANRCRGPAPKRPHRALAQLADEANLPAREFACTLLGAVVAADRALFLQIGDGVIVIDSGEDYRPVFWPQTGEYANETHFATDPDAIARLESVALTEPIAEIALLSDGLQLLALHYQSRRAHAPFFRPLFHRLREHAEPGCPAALAAALERFLASPALSQRTHDDKTLILATRRPAPAPWRRNRHARTGQRPLAVGFAGIGRSPLGRVGRTGRTGRGSE